MLNTEYVQELMKKRIHSWAVVRKIRDFQGST